MGLSGQVVVVTGGAKGFGAGITAALCERGASVWATGRDTAALEAIASEPQVRGLRADVTSPEDWDRVCETVLAEHGRLDILVNNAGAGIRIAPLLEMTDEEIREAIAVNLTGSILGCRRVAGVMKQAGSGTIVNISSVCQRQAWPGFSVYSAAKAGLGQFSNCLYAELREHGVRVTTLLPSWGATGFATAAGLSAQPPRVAERCIQPRELGELVAAVCELPAHLELQDLTLWPMVQKVEPL
jgi:NAD(P)-dependent dehydrogenase (short-subunit alcohol dehydrogenase family)